MKSSLFTTLIALTSMTLMIMTVRSSGLRGLQSVNAENIVAPSVPNLKINGISTLLEMLNSASNSTNSTFDVLTLDSFTQNVTDQGVVYEGKVTVANDQGLNITGLVNGTWDPVENKIVLSVSNYEVDAEDSGSEDPSDASDDNSDYITANGFTVLDMEVAKNDSNIVAAFDFSRNALIEKGERDNKIPISNYTVTEWSLASYKNKSNGIYYKFVAKLLGDNYVHVDTNMTYFRYNNETVFLAGYYYHAYNISKGALPNNFTDVDNNNNNTNTTLPSDNNNTNSTNNTAPQVTSDGYTIYAADQFAQDTIAQAALQYGAQALIQKALTQNKIPTANPNYTVNNVVLASYKKGVIGMSYKFVVNMTNVDYVHVDTNLTVFYRYSTKVFSLNGYSFKSYNYSSKANGNNNNNNSGTVVPPANNTTSPSNSTVIDQNNNSTVIDGGVVAPVENPTVVDSGVVAPVEDPTVIDSGVVAPVENPTVIDSGVETPVENPTVIDSGDVAPVDSSTVIDPTVPVVEDNSTVIDDGSANVSPVIDNAN